MYVMGKKLFTAFVCSLGLGTAYCLPSHAQSADASGFEIYRDLRTELIGQGWKPDSSNGLKDNRGRAIYRFPEVLCGPKICNAKWRDNKGKVESFTLLRGEGSEEYRVMPQ